MAPYHLSTPERYSVFEVHNRRCYLCAEPIQFAHMHVDHLIPTHLEKKPEELTRVKAQFGLENNFVLNSFENWLPTCSPCNLKKGAMVFQPTPIIQIWLDRAKLRAPEARRIRDLILNDAKSARILASLETALSQEQISISVVEGLVTDLKEERRAARLANYIGLGWRIIHDYGRMALVSGPRGEGIAPIDDDPAPSYRCGCGMYGPWHGAKCLSCGNLSSPDD